MAKIIIPFPLRKHTGNQREIVFDDPDLAGVMTNLLEQFPGLQFIHDNPDLLTVFINGKTVSAGMDDWQTVEVSENDEISLIIPIAGG